MKNARGIARARCAAHIGGLALAVSMAAQSRAEALQDSAPAESRSIVADEAPRDEIVVTARRREEKLQDVPDAITAISVKTIENSGIAAIDDFARLVPNLTFRNGSAYNAGYIALSMRGVGNGQQGWSSVSVIVDGVPVDSLDNLGGGNYEALERIEILRGPQSAVYGANAIAGAINIITRKPTDTLSGRVMAELASGDDKHLNASLSGPLIEDVLKYRVEVDRRKSDGLIRNASRGGGLDFHDDFRTRGNLLFTPTERLSFDARVDYDQTRGGAVYQSIVPGVESRENFSSIYDPRRRLVGEATRKMYRLSLATNYDFGAAELVSVTAYTHSNQNTASSLCYDDPDNPTIDTGAAPGIQTICLLGGTARGSSAKAGELVDEAFLARDSTRTFYQDLRLQSSGNTRFKWMFGGSYMRRKAVNGFDVRDLIAGPQGGVPCGQTVGFDPTGCGSTPIVYPSWNQRRDNWWGLYSQLQYQFTDQLELTLAGRYDNERYHNAQYQERALITPVLVPDTNGKLIAVQHERARSFQPKAQLSYKFTPSAMGYITYARGFRAGFFNTGAFTKPEQTDNYEAGFKSSFDVGSTRLTVNAAGFHIDYSNQQFSTIIPTPPFRVPVTIPSTKINGAEFEATLQLQGGLSFSASGGILDAKIGNGGGRPPYSPKFTGHVAVDYDHEIGGGYGLILHADLRHSSSVNLAAGIDPQPIGPKDYVNLRAGVTHGGFSLTGFVENLTNQREETFQGTPLGTGYIRYINEPRRYGVQLKYSF